MFILNVAIVLCIGYVTYALDSMEDPYAPLIGTWSGDLQFFSNSCADIRECSFEIEFASDYSFSIRIGAACSPRVVSCEGHGYILEVNTTTLSAQYPSCEDNKEINNCYPCDNNGTGLTFCWKYEISKSVMKLGMQKIPQHYGECVNSLTPSCVVNNNTKEEYSVSQVATLTCTNGHCVRCHPQTTCNGRGLCNDNGDCECFSGWIGSGCSKSDCPGDGCNGHGLCDGDTNACFCIPPWTGVACETSDVFAGSESLWTALAYGAVVCIGIMIGLLLDKYCSHAPHAFGVTHENIPLVPIVN